MAYVAIDEADGVQWEQIAVRSRGETSAEVCCIPFFAYDVALGDLIELEAIHGHGIVNRVLTSVTKRSTFDVYRTQFLESVDADTAKQELREATERADGLYEVWGESMWAIAVPTQHRHQFADLLDEATRKGLLEYEIGSRGT